MAKRPIGVRAGEGPGMGRASRETRRAPRSSPRASRALASSWPTWTASRAKDSDRPVRDLGLSRPQGRVLVYVLQNERLSPSSLARAMDAERAPLGQLVRALELRRLARRERSVADRRE